MKANCPNCDHALDIGAQVGAKVGGALFGAALVGGASRHPLGVLAGAIVGGLIGHAIDVNLLPSCPSCGIVLRVIAAL